MFRNGLIVAALARDVSAIVSKHPTPQTPSPLNGAPFNTDTAMGDLGRMDDPWTIVYAPGVYQKPEDNANVCMAGPDVDKDTCLGNRERDCMFIRTEGSDPTKPVQVQQTHCMPCEIDGQPIACWNLGANVNEWVVKECEMMCPHQLKIRQPEYTCSDESGFISQSECFDRGTRSGSKCMHLSLTHANGADEKSTCAPCNVEGTGSWSCPDAGTPFDENGYSVSECASQCDHAATGTLDPAHPSPGLGKTYSPPNQMLNAPANYPTPVNPLAAGYAAQEGRSDHPQEAARKMGYTVGVPDGASYFPFVMYRSPIDYMDGNNMPPAARVLKAVSSEAAAEALRR